ncbi:hypothetical protein GGG16DRAFT_118414 [Schizophyllum commune]
MATLLRLCRSTDDISRLLPIIQHRAAHERTITIHAVDAFLARTRQTRSLTKRVTQEGQINEQKGVAANLAAVESDLNGLLAALGPAIATLQNMNAILQAIVDDLTSIQKMATSAGTPAGVVVIGITDEQLTQKWADLAVAVGKYQQACVMDGAQMSTAKGSRTSSASASSSSSGLCIGCPMSMKWRRFSGTMDQSI